MSALSSGLEAWAVRRARRLADEFVTLAERGEAEAFFAAVCGRERLLGGALRPVAEAAFMERIAEREAGR